MEIIKKRDERIHLFLRLMTKGRDQSAVPEDYIDWVEAEGTATTESLERFTVTYQVHAGYLTIKLLTATGDQIFQTKFFRSSLIDFETIINYEFELQGSRYKHIPIEAQDAIGKTPKLA